MYEKPRINVEHVNLRDGGFPRKKTDTHGERKRQIYGKRDPFSGQRTTEK